MLSPLHSARPSLSGHCALHRHRGLYDQRTVAPTRRDVSLALLSSKQLNRDFLASLDAVRISDFDSAYYFDGGTFRYPVAGETHVNGTGQPSGGMDVKVSVVSEFR